MSFVNNCLLFRGDKSDKLTGLFFWFAVAVEISIAIFLGYIWNQIK